MLTLTMATSRMSKYSPGLQLKHWTEGSTAIFVSECLRLKWLDLCLYHSHQASAVILENGLQTDSTAPRLTLSVNTALLLYSLISLVTLFTLKSISLKRVNICAITSILSKYLEKQMSMDWFAQLTAEIHTVHKKFKCPVEICLFRSPPLSPSLKKFLGK